MKMKMKIKNNNLIDDQILQIENEIKTLRNSDLKIDLWTLIKKLNELKIIKNESMNKQKLRKCDRYKKFNTAIKKTELRTLTKTDHKNFSDPYQIRYNKQLLLLLLGAEF